MLEDRIEQWYEKIGKRLIIVLAVLIVGYLIVRFNILGLFAPFIVAWVFATVLNKFVTWANKKLQLARGMGTILSMITILSGILWIIYALIRKLWEQIIGFTNVLPDYTTAFLEQFNYIEEKLGGILSIFPVSEALMNIDTVIEKVMNGLSSFLGSIIPTATSVIAAVPDAVIFIIVTLVATFFMTKDFYKIKAFIKAQVSDTIVDRIVIMQRGVLQAIGGYVRTQLILMSITFVICLVGLTTFKIEYALLIAVIIAVVDALPLFGSGAILIPWAIYNMILGRMSIGVGLLCIYGVIFVVRQIMEPRILSQQIGVYSLVTVIAVYVGYKTMGILGMIIGPALVIIISMLQRVGALPQFKPVEKIDSRGDIRCEKSK